MMEQKTLRIGVLGAARIVSSALIAPTRQIEGLEIAAIAARDPQRARSFAAAHDIPRILDSYSDVINDPDIDAVYVPLPNSLHCYWSIRALRAGKHVLCEKPLAANASEAEEMARAVQDSHCVFAEAFHYRYHPLAARIRRILKDDVLGETTHFEAHFSVPTENTGDNIRFDWNLAGGATMDLGCYALQMLRHFAGMQPLVLQAKARVVAPQIDVAMEAELLFPNGATGRMTCSMELEAPLWASFQARGERGEIQVLNPVVPHLGHLLTLRTEAGELRETVDGEPTYVSQLRAFVSAVNGGPAMPTDIIEGIANMRLIDEVYQRSGLKPRSSRATV